jgi:hypothetical protein
MMLSPEGYPLIARKIDASDPEVVELYTKSFDFEFSPEDVRLALQSAWDDGMKYMVRMHMSQRAQEQEQQSISQVMNVSSQQTTMSSTLVNV